MTDRRLCHATDASLCQHKHACQIVSQVELIALAKKLYPMVITFETMTMLVNLTTKLTNYF